MIELHLIGYTEDGGHLVLDLDVDGEGRYLVPVDPELVATLAAVRGDGEEADAPEVDTVAPDGDTGTCGVATGVEGPSAVPAASQSALSPAQIQGRLRAGRSVRAVAREAGADPAWVERWHAPIVAERERVLADARSRRVDRPRARSLGAAVDRSLSDRGVQPDEAVWRVVRRQDGRWRVSVRFEQDGRTRTATWLLDPDAEHLRPQSPLATELAAPGGHAASR